MKEKKDLKKTFSIIGLIAVGLYLLFYLINNGINTFTTISMVGFNASTLSNIWAAFRTIILYGFMCFYLIFEITKKDNKNDKTMNIILFVVFCIIVLSSIISIGKTISTLVNYSNRLNGIIIFGYILDIIIFIFKIGLSVIFAINTMGLVVNKKMPAKVFMIIIFVLIGIIFLNTIASIIIDLIVSFNFKFVLLSINSFICILALSAFEGSLAYILYEKSKAIK